MELLEGLWASEPGNWLTFRGRNDRDHLHCLRRALFDAHDVVVLTLLWSGLISFEISPTDLSVVFSSALIVFAAMVIKHKHGLPVSGFEPGDFTGSLQRALDALENLGDDTRIARRCRKYLKKLLQVASVFSTYLLRT